MNSAEVRAGRAGFTLLEILVALVLIGLVVGALVPTVVNQLSRGEVTRVADDLGTISTAAQAFRVDVNRYPGDLDDLVMTLTTGSGGDTDVDAAAYPPGLASRWMGPYLEIGGLRAGNTLPTGLGGAVQNAFARTPWNGQNYLTVKVAGIAQTDAQAISQSVDGDAEVAATSEQAGQVRWKAGNGSAPDTLLFLAVPVR